MYFSWKKKEPLFYDFHLRVLSWMRDHILSRMLRDP